MTLGEVLALPLLRDAGAQLLAGGEAALTREVRWVHVSELESIASLLQGGELVLTTGLALGGSPERGVALVDSLAGVGASGLVVELGSALPAVPDAVVEAARRTGLPLVSLAEEVRFVALTEAVHSRIVGEQYADVQLAARVHETFTELGLREATTSEIVEHAAAMCRSSVVLEDVGHRVLAHSAVDEPVNVLLDEWERRSRTGSYAGTGGPAGSFSSVLVDVGPSGGRWARLVVPHPRAEVSAAGVRTVLERTASALELARMAERHRVALEFQAQGGLLDDVATGRAGSRADIEARAQALGLPPGTAYLPVVVRLGVAANETPLSVQQDLTRLVESVSAAAQGSAWPTLTGRRGEREVAVVGVLGDGVDEEALLRRFCQGLRDEGGHGLEAVGVGRVGATLREAVAALPEAALAAQVASATPGQVEAPLYHRAEDLRLRGLLGLLSTDPRVQTFVEAELRTLLAHEARHPEGLLEVLRVYLSTGGNKSEVSRRCHLSRPALYHRLDRLEQILGRDLSDAESRLSLHVALLAYDQRATSSREERSRPGPRSTGPPRPAPRR